MSYDPSDPTRSPWSPTVAPDATAPSPQPAVAPHYAPRTHAGTYPIVDSPPLGGASWRTGDAGGTPPPSWPPASPAAPSSTPPPFPASTATTAPAHRGRGGVVAVAAVAALFAGVAGGVVGSTLFDKDGTSGSSAGPVATQTVSTEIPPLDGTATEPAAAVAAALGPAVVQIETQAGLGSGFIYDDSGLIMTAFHVTDGATSVQVRMADGTRATGEVLGGDPSTDVAVVKIDPTDDMPVATLATGVKIQVGQTAIAIGSPFGLDQTVTAGIVSAVGRSSETPGGVIPAIQTDAPINSGNSGGALADRQGRIIGINDSIITGGGDATGNVGVGFAIPIDIAKGVADKIVAGEPTEAGFLGVEGVDASGDQAGAAISDVSAGSPADDAGLNEGDLVVAVDGRKVSSMIDLAAAVRTHQPGDQVELTIEVDGDQRTLTVTLATAPAN